MGPTTTLMGLTWGAWWEPQCHCQAHDGRRGSQEEQHQHGDTDTSRRAAQAGPMRPAAACREAKERGEGLGEPGGLWAGGELLRCG